MDKDSPHSEQDESDLILDWDDWNTGFENVTQQLLDAGAITSRLEIEQFPSWFHQTIFPLFVGLAEKYELTETPGYIALDQQIEALVRAMFTQILLRKDEELRLILDSLPERTNRTAMFNRLIRGAYRQTLLEVTTTIADTIFISPSIIRSKRLHDDGSYDIVMSNLSELVDLYQQSQELDSEVATVTDANSELLLEPQFDNDPILDAVLGGLAVRQQAIKRLEEESQQLSDQARELGATWSTIGKAAEITHSGAYKRWDRGGKERNRQSQRNYMTKLRGDEDAETDA